MLMPFELSVGAVLKMIWVIILGGNGRSPGFGEMKMGARP